VSYWYGFNLVVPFFLYFTFVMIAVSGIDIPYQIIPDFFSISLIIVGLCGSFANPLLGEGIRERIVHSVLGGLTGGGILIVLGFLGAVFFKKEAMGGGDVKLLAAIGTFVGWHRVLSTLFIASFFGTIVGIYLIVSKKVERRGYIPFGPFLALAGYINLFIADPLTLLAKLRF
jgi:leader peptidase (prepilin peptidase)/N-methyltransferase